jgi:hypothetical protein
MTCTDSRVTSSKAWPRSPRVANSSSIWPRRASLEVVPGGVEFERGSSAPGAAVRQARSV